MCASTKIALPPLASISAATRLPRSPSRSANATFAPSATKRRTVASPMPDAPLVTAAIFPVSLSMGLPPQGQSVCRTLGDRIGQGQHSARVVDVQVLDQAAVEHGHAATVGESVGV